LGNKFIQTRTGPSIQIADPGAANELLEKLPLSIIKACVPVDGDTYDVPMQIKTVEEKRAKSYQMTFGDEESQKNLSSVTHVTKGKNIPPFLILHVADHPGSQPLGSRFSRPVLQGVVSVVLLENNVIDVVVFCSRPLRRIRPFQPGPVGKPELFPPLPALSGGVLAFHQSQPAHRRPAFRSWRKLENTVQ